MTMNVPYNIEMNGGLAVCEVGDVLISVWHDPVVTENWLWYRARMDRLMKKHVKIVCLSVLLPESSPPDIRQRTVMEKDLKAAADQITKYILVLPDSGGVFAGVARVIVRTAFLLIRRPGVHEFCDSVGEASDRTVKYGTPATPRANTLNTIVGEMLRKVTPAPTSQENYRW